MNSVQQEKTCLPSRRLPAWFAQPIPKISRMKKMKAILSEGNLTTVCEGAHCPNQGQCWGQGVATFMILGAQCTHACRFCAVKTGSPSVVDIKEPQQVALAVQALNLRYVVVTSVTRDDLSDGGAELFAQTITAIRQRMPQTKIEVLIPDFLNKRDSLELVVQAGPDVIGHNMETVRRVSLEVRPQADYQRSLDVLRTIRGSSTLFVKSGLMVGLGETDEEVKETMQDLVGSGCDILTIGQYLAPSQTPRHVPVSRFVPPEKFEEYARWGKIMGFKYIESGPLVRSSYLEEKGYQSAVKQSCHKKDQS